MVDVSGPAQCFRHALLPLKRGQCGDSVLLSSVLQLETSAICWEATITSYGPFVYTTILFDLQMFGVDGFSSPFSVFLSRSQHICANHLIVIFC